MSRRRKIRRRAHDESRRTFESVPGENGRGVSVSSISFFARDAHTGQPVFASIGWAVEPDKMKYMPVYQRAHELMRRPRSILLDPDEYRKEQAPAIAVLDKSIDKERIPSEDILCALAVLGHSPNRTAIRALSRFASSNHSLAPVAKLALSECAGLFSFFRKDSIEPVPYAVSQ